MRRYAAASATIFVVLLALFVIGERWHVALVADPSAQMHQGGFFAALVGVGLLMADAVFPVPSSLVMITHGAVFGVVAGTLLSVVGSMGATLIGFALGRRGSALLTRCISPHERATADRLLARWGALAIMVTRPVPLLAETVAILAGASPIGWRRAAMAALAGAAPVAAIYALAGATVAGSESGVLVLAIALALGGCAWLVEWQVGPLLVRHGDWGLTERSSDGGAQPFGS
jgi:uncharacterized membrane protein YdjX (TVP38/TMEM64 family)